MDCQMPASPGSRVAALMKFGEFIGRQRETAVQREATMPNTPSLVPDAPDRSKATARRRSRSVPKKVSVGKVD